MKLKLTAAQGMMLLQESHPIKHYVFEEDFLVYANRDKDGECNVPILIEDCMFLKNVNFVTSFDYNEVITLRNCHIFGYLSLYNIFSYKPVLIESCHCIGQADMSSGAFYDGVTLIENTFEGFADFLDQDIRGKAIFINNRFNGGTNLMHPSGSPNGAQFEHPPYLEGNTGLERYVRPED